jgi:aryl-alcohol dehydrogenase-like predicted oxidoreductase
MEYRNLGRTGLKVSELCLGTMTFGWGADEPTSQAIMDRAVEAGINFFDTANMYSRWAEGNEGGVAETWIGNWLRARSLPRHNLVIATKVRGQMSDDPQDQGLSRRHIMQAVEGSLRRLDTDYIDLYQSHWPDEDTPQEETLRAFDDLVQQGKVRYIGCSNYQANLLTEALRVSKEAGLARYETLQPHYNLVHREEFERELRAVCQERGLGVIPYSPLAGGFLTGKYRRGEPVPAEARGATSEQFRGYMTERNFALIDLLENLGKARGKTIAQMALGWQLSQPVITSPIIGARTLQQLEENLGALGLRLSADEMARLDAAGVWE